MQKAELDWAFQSLQNELGKAVVLFGSDVPDRNANDHGKLLPCPPQAVFRPSDAQELSEVVLFCRRWGLKFVAQGGLTGLCGGARPEPEWVAISLDRMTGVEEIDAPNSTMTVKAGTPLETVQNAADEAGLLFPLDLGARGSCTIGGNISTNAGGNRVIRYGMTRDLVLGLEVVLADGSIVSSLNKLIKNNTGYDLKQLFIGSEGTLGIITRAVLRLHPRPRHTDVAICALENYAQVQRLLTAAREELGAQLTAFEVMWRDFWDAVTPSLGARPPIDGSHEFYVLIENQVTQQGADGRMFQDWLEAMLEAGHLADAAISQSEQHVRNFWAVRDAVAEFGRILGDYISYDVGLSVEQMDEFASRCRAELGVAMPGAQSLYYGHIGDGNLHVIVWAPGIRSDAPKDSVDGVIYGIVRELGGSISAEHGIGSTRKKWLSYSRTSSEVALMRLLKNAMDPDGFLNPGKVIPG